jgi:hypothetical protein
MKNISMHASVLVDRMKWILLHPFAQMCAHLGAIAVDSIGTLHQSGGDCCCKRLS